MGKIEVNLIRGFVVKRLMRTLAVVKVKPLIESFPQRSAVVKGPQVKILVFERPPQPLDENIILNPATAVHADLDLMRFEHFGESLGGKLSSLIGIEDFRSAEAAKCL